MQITNESKINEVLKLLHDCAEETIGFDGVVVSCGVCGKTYPEWYEMKGIGKIEATIKHNELGPWQKAIMARIRLIK